MEKKKSKKVMSWTTKDGVLVALTYVLNTIVIAMLFSDTFLP